MSNDKSELERELELLGEIVEADSLFEPVEDLSRVIKAAETYLQGEETRVSTKFGAIIYLELVAISHMYIKQNGQNYKKRIKNEVIPLLNQLIPFTTMYFNRDQGLMDEFITNVEQYLSNYKFQPKYYLLKKHLFNFKEYLKEEVKAPLPVS